MYKLCKTEQSATRQRELEQKLMQLMNIKRYEDISVSDFCSFAGIPRKAFYRYFSGKDGALYALMDHTLMEYAQYRTPYLKDDPKDLIRELECFFGFWQMQKPLLDALKLNGLSGVLLDRVSNSIQQLGINRMKPGENEFFYNQIVWFAVSGIMTMVINWHSDGLRESTWAMAAVTAGILNTKLSDYVRGLI